MKLLCIPHVPLTTSWTNCGLVHADRYFDFSVIRAKWPRGKRLRKPCKYLRSGKGNWSSATHFKTVMPSTPNLADFNEPPSDAVLQEATKLCAIARRDLRVDAKIPGYTNNGTQHTQAHDDVSLISHQIACRRLPLGYFWHSEVSAE